MTPAHTAVFLIIQCEVPTCQQEKAWLSAEMNPMEPSAGDTGGEQPWECQLWLYHPMPKAVLGSIHLPLAPCLGLAVEVSHETHPSLGEALVNSKNLVRPHQRTGTCGPTLTHCTLLPVVTATQFWSARMYTVPLPLTFTMVKRW